MKYFLPFLFFMPLFVDAQVVFPDSLKNTYVARLEPGESYTFFRYVPAGCRRMGYYEKFIIDRGKDAYRMKAYKPLFFRYDLQDYNYEELLELGPALSLHKKMRTYRMTDTAVLALAYVELLSSQCEERSRGTEVFTMKYRRETKQIKDYCPAVEERGFPFELLGEEIEDMYDLKEIVFTEKYYDDFWQVWHKKRKEYQRYREREKDGPVSDSIWLSGKIRPDTLIQDVFPNPSHGIFNLTIPKEILQIKVYNAQGRLVLEQRAPFDSVPQFDLSDQSHGIYLIRIETSEGVEVRKLVLQKQ